MATSLENNVFLPAPAAFWFLPFAPLMPLALEQGPFVTLRPWEEKGKKKRRLENGALFLLTHERLRVREKSVLLLGEKMR